MTGTRTRRGFLKALGAGAMALPGSLGVSRLVSGTVCAAGRPNVLFFFTDDQRYDTVRALGNDQVVTPNMDRFVRSGVSFTHAHIMGSFSGAVCMPSRAMLMTGRSLWRCGGKTLSPEHVTMPEVFRKAGYQTFETGKWHQDTKSFARGFSAGGKIFFGGMSNHWKVPVHDFDPAGRYPKDKRYQGKKHSSELFADAAVEFLRGRDRGKPFFLYLAFTAPHDPRHMPKQYLDMYPPAKIKLPKSFMPRHPFDNGEMKIRDERLEKWPRTKDAVRRHIAAYFAMITHADANIGRVLEALEKTGGAANTIIVFAGDNGLAVGRHGLMGKQNLYDHSVRVPLVFSGPGIPKGVRRDALCYLYDIYPTLCELAGLAVPRSVEGKSLRRAIRDPRGKVRDTLYCAYRGIQRSVRDLRYKLIEYHVKRKRTTQLFDLEADPWELTNLATDRSRAGDLRRLRAELVRLKKELGDTQKLGQSFWQGWGAGR